MRQSCLGQRIPRGSGAAAMLADDWRRHCLGSISQTGSLGEVSRLARVSRQRWGPYSNLVECGFAARLRWVKFRRFSRSTERTASDREQSLRGARVLSARSAHPSHCPTRASGRQLRV